MSFNGRPLSGGMRGNDVSHLHKLLTHLGYTISDDERRNYLYGESTRETVIKFQTTHRLEPTGVVDESTTAELTKLAKEKNYPTVSGKIITNLGVAVKDLKVIALDKTLDQEIELGDAITDTFGNYTVLYQKEIGQTRKQKLDIKIKVVDPQEVSKIYGESAIHFNVDDQMIINLVLNNDRIKEMSEYSKIMSDLIPYVSNRSFKELIENEEQQDISYLANKTGWDARLVAMVSFANSYSTETGIPPDFYYALFRAGITTNIDELYRTNSLSVEMIWEKSVEENIVDVTLKSSIAQNLIKFREIAGIHNLERAKPVGVSSLKELLNISLPDIWKQREFVDLYFNNTGDMKRFWADVEAKFGKETSDKLRLDGKLAYLTNNNADLIGKLYSNNLIQNSPIDLIKNGLYKKEAWESLFRNGVTIPGDMLGKTDDEKKSNYIDYMVFQLKLSYPTSIVAEMVNNDELKVQGDSSIKKEVYQFLHDMQDKFKIGTEPLRKVLHDNQMQLGENTLNELKKLERVYQISPSDDAMKVLWANNLHSALAVIQYDITEFIGNFKEELGGEETAKMIYAKAHQVHSTVLNMAVSYMTIRNSPNVYAISGLQPEKKEIPP